jgi:hypothetical protein
VTAEYVTLVLDRYDGSGNPIVKGTASWAPSAELPDPADMMLVGQAPVTASFRAGSLPTVKLISNDSIGPQQGNGTPGWAWNVTYDGVPGSPAAAGYYILSTNGTTQYLSALASAPVAQPGQQYFPVNGTGAAGYAGTGSLAPNVVTLVDAATVEVDAALGNDFRWPIGGNHTLGAPGNATDGQVFTVDIAQPASGGPWTPSFASGAGGYAFGADGQPSWSTAAGAVDEIAFRFNVVKGMWLCQGWKLGF